MKFEDLNIIEPILKGIKEKGYISPSAIQEKAIPPLLKGQDLLGCAQTGTGKTAAFAIPILQMLYNKEKEANSTRKIKALILTPTRELAIQIRDSFRDYGKHTDLRCSVIFGGVNQHSQVEVLKKGIDILVATPGRLLDLISQKHAKLGDVEYFVLDEADSMLDMGFIYDVKRVITHLPDHRQTIMFSATMPAEITKLADTFLHNPVKVMVTPIASTVDKTNQVVYFVDKNNKPKLLLDILKNVKVESALIFTRTKHGANKLVKILTDNKINCAAIHGNKSQSARQLALGDFKTGKINVLVATDIAARGIDISGLSHVINYELPNVPETYVHRIGRTGRAGLAGNAISLCDYDEKSFLKSIEKLIDKQIEVIEDHTYPMMIHHNSPVPAKQPHINNYKRATTSGKPLTNGKPSNGFNRNKTNFRNNFGNHNQKFASKNSNPNLFRKKGHI